MKRDSLRLASWALLAVASVGTIICAVLHVWVLRSAPWDDPALDSGIKYAILILCLPVAFLGWHLHRERSDKEFETAVVRGTPRWLRLLISGIWLYGVALFISSFLWRVGGTALSTGLGLAFYAGAVAVGVSGARAFKGHAG